MALVKTLEKLALERPVPHRSVLCTYSIVTDDEAGMCLQLDTYGSVDRQVVGKKSQSIRLTSEAIRQLKEIFAENGL